jgi:hypothetical protein
MEEQDNKEEPKASSGAGAIIGLISIAIAGYIIYTVITM